MALNDAQLVLRGPKSAKKISPTPLHHLHESEPLRQGRMDPWFHVLYAKFWPYHLNVAAEIETPQTRQRFFNLLLSNFGESVQIVASVSCFKLTGAAPGVVFCCCSPSASGFDVLCVQRWYSAYLGCLSYCCLYIISNQSVRSPDLWHQQGIFVHTTFDHSL